jgi:hypothetical protein
MRRRRDEDRDESVAEGAGPGRRWTEDGRGRPARRGAVARRRVCDLAPCLGGGRWGEVGGVRESDGKPEEENPPPSTGLNFQKIAHLQTKIMKIAPYGSLVHQ